MPEEKQHKTETPAEQNNKPEVRYIPVEYLPEMHSDDDEIDLLELGRKIWDGRKTIIKITAIFIVFGVFWALFSPVEYESEAILMPEAQAPQEGRAGQLLQQFGGAFGLGGLSASEMPQGMIPPQIYPQIVNSLSFQLELLDKEVRFAEAGVTTTWPDYLENHHSTPLTGLLVAYTVKLPFTILKGVRSLLEEDEGSGVIAEGRVHHYYG